MTKGNMSRWRRLPVAVTMLALLALGLPVGNAAAEETGSPEPAQTQTTTTPAEGGESSETPSGTPDDTEPADEAEETEPASPEEEQVNPWTRAAVATLNIGVSVSADGTPSWDADSNAGNDSSASNGIVRVNDTVTYAVQYNVTDANATNVSWAITFPKGMEITEVPGYCSGPGSAISPATAGTPSLPLSATSIDQLSQQTLLCNMGDVNAETAPVSNTVFVTVKVLNLAHQGQDLPLVKADITADGVAAPVEAAGLPSVKASSRLKWDISKNGVALQADSGYRYGPTLAACYWDTSRTCFFSDYPITFSAPANGKGAMPAIGNVSFTDDLSPAALYPELSGADLSDMNTDLTKYGSRIQAWVGGLGHMYPYGKITGAATESNSVRDSGSITVSSGGSGLPATVTISSADWSLRTYPSTSGLGEVAMPADTALAISGAVRLWTPVDTVKDFGIEQSNTWVLKTTNTYTDLEIQGFDPMADVQTSANQPTWNDYRTTSPKIELLPGFRKDFVGVPGAPGNTDRMNFRVGDRIFEGPPGGATYNSGGITVAPTQQVVSTLEFSGSASAAPAEVGWVGCDVWDSSLLNLRADDYQALTIDAANQGGGQAVSSGGQAVWVSGYNNVPLNATRARWATAASETPELVVQYSTGTAGAGASSECSSGTWYDDPASVPGNDPALAGQGVYSAVSRVRVQLVLGEPTAIQMADAGKVRAIVSIGMQVVDTDEPAGTIIPNWASGKSVVSDATLEEILSAPGSWTRSSYSPAAHSGALGDRLILAHAQARITKQVRKGESGDFSSTPPQVTGGDAVQYQLAPSLTSGAATPGILKDVWVEDCLPASQAYDSASVVPAVVQATTPADAKRPACATGETYIRWVLPDQEVNQFITPIILSVQVSPTADDGVYENTVVVWAEDDVSTLAQRRDEAQIQIANIAGIKLEKAALTPVVQNNRTDATEFELNKWTVTLTNTLPASEQSTVSAPDIIDVLPKQGSNGTTFNGTFEFVEAHMTEGGATVRILYTSAATVNQDPTNSTNQAGGSTTWCDAPVGGNVVSGTGTCPTSAAQVTGLRVQRPGAFSTGEKIGIELSMKGVGNVAGDVYVNRAFARATGLEFPVGPLVRPETVVSSSIGDFVWWDFNRDGEQNQFNGSDEPAARGVTVQLSGTDDLGNAVSLTTTTDSLGKYGFAGLRSAGEGGYTVTFVKPDAAESFTSKNAESVAEDVDSDADPSTGAADPLVLASNSADQTIDAGLLVTGSLEITKLLEGEGVVPFGYDDELTFSVVCSFEGAEIHNEEVTLAVNGVASVVSEPIDGLPAYSSCIITETGIGDADEAPAPVTVSIPWDAEAQSSSLVSASLTNYYSAGQLRVTKILSGDKQAVDKVRQAEFVVLVTCEVGEGETLATVFSGEVTVRGGEFVDVVDDNGDLVKLPLGASCYGEEIDDGGAQTAVVDYDSSENAVTVDTDDPSQMQQLTITATNTFRCTGDCGLAYTGGDAWTLGLSALAALALGGALVLARRRAEA